jgi:hypothetical protein
MVIPILLGLLGRANLNHWTSGPVSETLFPSYLEIRTTDKVHKPCNSEWGLCTFLVVCGRIH